MGKIEDTDQNWQECLKYPIQAFQKVPQVSWGWKASNLHIGRHQKGQNRNFWTKRVKNMCNISTYPEFECRIHFMALLIILKWIWGFSELFCKRKYKRTAFFDSQFFQLVQKTHLPPKDCSTWYFVTVKWGAKRLLANAERQVAYVHPCVAHVLERHVLMYPFSMILPRTSV